MVENVSKDYAHMLHEEVERALHRRSGVILTPEEKKGDTGLDFVADFDYRPCAVEIKHSQKSALQAVKQASRYAERHRRLAGKDARAILVIGGPAGAFSNDPLNENNKQLRSIAYNATRDTGYDAVILHVGEPRESRLYVGHRGRKRYPNFQQVPDLQAAFALLFTETAQERLAGDAGPLLMGDAGDFHAGDAGSAYSPLYKQKPEKFLLVSSEWAPSTGGISSFNNAFAEALIQQGHDVCIALPQITDSELEEARSMGIAVAVSKGSIPGIEGLPSLLSGLKFLSVDTFSPDVIVGHGRIIGPYAYALQGSFSKRPVRLHVVHMDPESLEHAKEGQAGEPRTGIARDRRALEVELARTADIVAGVGKRLTDWIHDELNALPGSPPPVTRIIPGLRDWDGVQENPPTRRVFLLSGRIEDFDSKGVDIAIRSMAEATSRRPNQIEEIQLVLRGVPEDHRAIRARVNELVGSSGLNVILRTFTTDAAELRRDLFGATAVLMPSRHEGFGLAGYEAMAAGVPTLISKRSGLADLLREIDPAVNDREVLDVANSIEVATWADAICRILDAPQEAALRATTLRNSIASRYLWESSIATLLEHLIDL